MDDSLDVAADVLSRGHAIAKITWVIYQHVTPTMQADAAETVARLIFGPPANRDEAYTDRRDVDRPR